jgi:hypothetical protein
LPIGGGRQLRRPLCRRPRAAGPTDLFSHGEVPSMISRLLAAATFAFARTMTVGAFAQADPADNPLEAGSGAEPELTWQDYTVKAYTVQIFGGWFGGAEYLNLPVKGPRTYLQGGYDPVMSYSGSWFERREGPGGLDYDKYDAPIKRIDDGFTAGLKLGSYLADNFHIDIAFAYSATQAVLTMVNKEDPDDLVREEIDRDPNVQVLRGALQIMYDLDEFRILGFSPYLGLGFGGIITRFSNLPDVGGLFLVGTFGLQRTIVGNASVFVQADLTTFSMSRDELHYTKSVTYKDLSAGISFYFDTVPADIRALHEAQQADRRRR